MNIIPMAGDGLTMSSREIAELTGKRHDNVMADIRRMLAELHGEGGVLNFQDTHRNPQNGQEYPVFLLPKRETLILVSGYSVQMRARIIDRWQELEAKATQPAIPQTLPEALRLAAEAIERNEKLALENKAQSEVLAEQAPKVQALDRIATYSDGSFCVRDAAKNLQVQEKRLRQWLSEHNWIYRRPMGSGWLAYSDKLKAGLLEHKITTGNKADGSEWTDTQVRVTAKGLAKLALLLPPDDGFFPPPINGASPRPHA